MTYFWLHMKPVYDFVDSYETDVPYSSWIVKHSGTSSRILRH